MNDEITRMLHGAVPEAPDPSGWGPRARRRSFTRRATQAGVAMTVMIAAAVPIGLLLTRGSNQTVPVSVPTPTTSQSRTAQPSPTQVPSPSASQTHRPTTTPSASPTETPESTATSTQTHPSTPARPATPRIRDLVTEEFTHQGIGAIKVGASLSSLAKSGYAQYSESDECSYWGPSRQVSALKISLAEGRNTTVASVSTTNPDVATASGARVGMTIGEVKAAYGNSFRIVAKINHGVRQYFGSVRDGVHELQFRVPGEPDANGQNQYAPTRRLRDTDRVAEITAQLYTTDVTAGGC